MRLDADNQLTAAQSWDNSYWSDRVNVPILRNPYLPAGSPYKYGLVVSSHMISCEDIALCETGKPLLTSALCIVYCPDSMADSTGIVINHSTDELCT